MYTASALLDIHERCHTTFAKLIDHCGTLTTDELHRELDGFGYPTVQLQLHHVIGAEKYWTGVIEGRMDVDDAETDFPTIESLESFRADVAGITRTYLESASNEELNTPRLMKMWGGTEKELVPALVILRPQTHIYHHQGQILAMCRIIGKPANGFDFPLL